MAWKLNRILSVVTMTSSVIALGLVLKRPQPIAEPQIPAVAAVNSESFQEKIQQLESANDQGQSPTEVRLNSAEVTAAFTTATSYGAATGQNAQAEPVRATFGPSFESTTGGVPSVQSYQVNFEGDIARGQFATKIAGKDVYVTLAGHLGSKDGYATFEPTEFKVGELDIPASLVNVALQKRLAEQRDQLKLPDSVESIRVENGELVMVKK